MSTGPLIRPLATLVTAVAAVDPSQLRTPHGDGRTITPPPTRIVGDIAAIATSPSRTVDDTAAIAASPTRTTGDAAEMTPPANRPPADAPAREPPASNPAAARTPATSDAAPLTTALPAGRDAAHADNAASVDGGDRSLFTRLKHAVLGDGDDAGPQTPREPEAADASAARPTSGTERRPAADGASPSTALPGWKEAPPPLVIAALPVPVRWFERGDGGHGGNERRPHNDDRQHRFLAEIVSEDGGRVQVDGLARLHGRTVSLIVRSEHPLDAEAKQTIAAIFADGTALAGWSGELTFRGDGFVAIEAPPPCPAACRLSV
jgi:hypothetical protein